MSISLYRKKKEEEKRVELKSYPIELESSLIQLILNELQRSKANWNTELSYSNIFPFSSRVDRIWELFHWIRELSNSITERCKLISFLIEHI